MSEILANLHPALHINWPAMGIHTEPAPPEEITELQKAFSDVPSDYLDVISTHEVAALITAPPHEPFFTIDFLCPLDILAWRDWYPSLEKDLPNCFIFATDGDDCFFMGENEGQHGVYRVGIAAGGWQSASYLAPSIRKVLCDGEGWANGELE